MKSTFHVLRDPTNNSFNIYLDFLYQFTCHINHYPQPSTNLTPSDTFQKAGVILFFSLSLSPFLSLSLSFSLSLFSFIISFLFLYLLSLSLSLSFSLSLSILIHHFISLPLSSSLVINNPSSDCLSCT